MEKHPSILLDRQTLTIKAVFNELDVSNSGQLLFKMKGISLIPLHTKIEPLEIKNNLVKKSEENLIDIQNQLYQGNYFVNILDYELGEITFAANFICDKWSKLIIAHLIQKNSDDKGLQITLTHEAIKKYILEANPSLFKSTSEIDNFCKSHNISVEKFVIPAKFNQLKIELEGITARLSSEIFFFRKKLFAELFIQKMEQQLYYLKKDEKIELNNENKEIYYNWKAAQLNEIRVIQKYIKSPFTFDDLEQFSNFRTITEFTPQTELQQDLISETFYWIDNFPKVKNRFERAVSLFNDRSDQNDCVNNLRLTLELLVKRILKNDKSLENQLGEIGKYQEELGIGVEIRNTFNKVLDYYNKYQNNRVKHDTNINNEHEVEFIFGLTMIFIRLLIKPNNELNKNNGK